MATDLPTLLAGFTQTFGDVATVCADLTPEQWALPTDLPGWSVQDNVSHIVAEEAYQLGDPLPEHELAGDFPHLRSEFAREVEMPIDYRRSMPGEQVLAELRTVTARRLEVLRGYDEAALAEEVPFAGRSMPLRNALGIRLFDCWTHSQDIRRALGRPGGLDNPAAALTLTRLLRSMSGLAEDVPAAAGRTLVIATTGELSSVCTLALGDAPSYAEGETTEADVHLTTDFETFLRLATGRTTYDAVAADVTLSGDRDLGVELARKMAVTP
jgi:uncharacterized protein (TIGR03083 family)